MTNAPETLNPLNVVLNPGWLPEPLTQLMAVAGPPVGDGWPARIDDLGRVGELTDDWDGQGSVAPVPAIVEGAVRLAGHLRAADVPPPDFAIAGSNGTVLFEWHTPAGYLELEVETPTVAEGRFVPTGAETAQVFAVTIR